MEGIFISIRIPGRVLKRHRPDLHTPKPASTPPHHQSPWHLGLRPSAHTSCHQNLRARCFPPRCRSPMLQHQSSRKSMGLCLQGNENLGFTQATTKFCGRMVFLPAQPDRAADPQHCSTHRQGASYAESSIVRLPSQVERHHFCCLRFRVFRCAKYRFPFKISTFRFCQPRHVTHQH